MKPSIGRIVVVKGIVSNNQDEHPAIVNCVHGPAGDSLTKDPYYMANVTAFPDCGTPQSVTSVYIFADKEQAMGYRHANSMPELVVAFWPARVE